MDIEEIGISVHLCINKCSYGHERVMKFDPIIRLAQHVLRDWLTGHS
jgi:hypothetical protein